VIQRQDRISAAIEDHPLDYNAREDLDDEDYQERRRFELFFKVISVLLLIVLVCLAIWVNNFEKWISWVAGIAATSIAFILPSLFYMGATTQKNTGNIYYVLSWITLVIGLVCMCLNVFSNIYGLFH
jgi:amino acid permease